MVRTGAEIPVIRHQRRVKYFTRDTLIKANKVAIKTDRNRTLHPNKLRKLDPELRLPIIFSMVHNDVELRLAICVDDKPTVVWLDVPFETYDKLPDIEVTTESSVDAVDAAHTMAAIEAATSTA